MKHYIIIAMLLGAVLLVAGCSQQQAPQPTTTTTQAPGVATSSFGNELDEAGAADSDLGDPDTSGNDDVAGTL
ncbi:MAG: hypothetical protein HYY37_00230 [Candidatus Aenigmarchaeota archaeon]|nr:hypothetical protein [Candidatus Aenigmarchaeota archaeon]